MRLSRRRVHVSAQIVKAVLNISQEKMEAWLMSVKLVLDKRMQKLAELSAENLVKAFSRAPDLTKPFEYLLATGNLQSKTGMKWSIFGV